MIPRLGYILFGSLVLSLFASFLYLESNHVTATREEHRTAEDVTLQAWLQSRPSHDPRHALPQLQLKALPTNATEVHQPRSTGSIIAWKRGDGDGFTRFNKVSQMDPNLPPLSSLLDRRGNVTGDVQFLLDFAIIGFGKCGTSTIMHWLAQHPQVRCFQDEIWELMYGTVAQLVQMLYQQNQRCYKCPAEITQARILDVYAALWPRTKLFVGIRHPVRQFESLYNFRVQNLAVSAKEELHMPHPNKLIGRCTKGMKHTCTDMANYAYHLIRLGKQHWNGTRPETPLERQIVGRYRRALYNTTSLTPQPNPIFLYMVEQLADRSATRQAQFRSDVEAFLGLSTPLSPLLHFSPGRRWTEAQQKKRDALKINVCQAEYAPVRRELMRLAAQNGAWISEFLTFPGVTVSSPDYVRQLLEDWKRDPCTNETYPAIALRARDSSAG